MSKRVPKEVPKRVKNGPRPQIWDSKKTKSEIVLRLERERLLEGKTVLSLESQLNRGNPFFSTFARIVLRLQREHSLEGTKKTCLDKEREARFTFLKRFQNVCFAVNPHRRNLMQKACRNSKRVRENSKHRNR